MATATRRVEMTVLHREADQTQVISRRVESASLPHALANMAIARHSCKSHRHQQRAAQPWRTRGAPGPCRHDMARFLCRDGMASRGEARASPGRPMERRAGERWCRGRGTHMSVRFNTSTTALQVSLSHARSRRHPCRHSCTAARFPPPAANAQPQVWVLHGARLVHWLLFPCPSGERFVIVYGTASGTERVNPGIDFDSRVPAPQCDPASAPCPHTVG